MSTRWLRPGGRFAVSDVVVRGEVPDEVRASMLLWVGCIAGALEENDYRGKLLDGSEFDSSYSRGQAATFPVAGVIKGWQEALVMMKPGAKWVLFVPPELAYGPAARPKIPGNSVLIFDVNLLSVEPSNAPPKAPPGTPPSPPHTK